MTPPACRIVLIKPFQPVSNISFSPPLGLLYLAAGLRQRFGSRIEVEVLDAKVNGWTATELLPALSRADIVGFSALNYEAEETFRLANAAKNCDPNNLVVLGGPLAHGRALEMLSRCANIDWVFDGESDRTFPDAVARYLEAGRLDGTIPGMYFRRGGAVVAPPGNDFIADLEMLPMPAWDLVDLDLYARSACMNTWMKGRRYATLFTSRGCPYKCSYCHDLFTKKFRWRSAENVLAEIAYLVDNYGVDEFEIIDDIFNLHKPRLKQIMQGVAERYGNRLHFCFPNGLRGDILDNEVIEALRRAGAYQITVAVETVTPRLQSLIQKNLDVAKVRRVVDYCHNSGILVKGYFMIGFPTESLRDIFKTIWFAWRSNLTFVSFFTVVPQPHTPLYTLAQQEGPEALRALGDEDYHARRGWYERTHGVPIGWISRLATLLFFMSPARVIRIVRHVGFRRSRSGLYRLLQIVLHIKPRVDRNLVLPPRPVAALVP